MLEKDKPGADVGSRTLEWHSVLVIDESAVFRQHRWRWLECVDGAATMTTPAGGSAADAEVEIGP